MDKLIRDILIVPERVHKGDFVLNLADGVTKPEDTLAQYVVTPQLVDCFDDALGFIRSGIEAGSSKACYLHGSFGSGKSHFMAVLHSLLEHNPVVRSLEDLAPVCATHEWVEDKRFLMVPYHMIGSRNMESAVLGGYVDHVTKRHPEAPLPGVYLADEIFGNARQHREQLGDEKFFAALNKSAEGASSGWGRVDTGWTAGSFEAAMSAPPGNRDRQRLVGDLVENIFPAFRGIAQGKDEAYVSLDEGLSILSAHAGDLGYDGLILFLDELILWLASRSADLNFVQSEGNKLAKLVESRRTDRPVPIVSFVARQRDLRELIGDGVTGAALLNFSDILGHWEGRFHTITLDDRNLPVIAQKRVLRPKDDGCKAELDRAFEETTRVRQEIMEVLLTRDADKSLFRKVYPFSPALIETLVAVSGALQRERTALKIMLELLVKRRSTLRLGDVIPVGDMWDVIAHGDEAFSDVMKARFETAKKLYHNKLRPMLEDQYQLDADTAEERAASDPDLAGRLERYRNDDRLIKTLLLAAVTPGVKTLENLTALRLAALNHGTIKSRIPNREHQVVQEKLRAWAGMVGEIRVGDEPINPTVEIQLSGVDTEAIIERARAYDNASNRQRKVREILFHSMEIPDEDSLFIAHNFWWRGTRRSCTVLFTNVRDLPDESLRSQDEWKLVIDFPFDSEGHTPMEDVDRVQRFRESGEPAQTLVWMPTFFSPRSQTELGKLVIIENLLRGDNLELHTRDHLSVQDRAQARMLLENQKSALSSRLQQIVEAAYAIRPEPTSGSLDKAYDLSEYHFTSLCPELVPERPVGANLGEALEHLLDQAFSVQYPKHPKFEQQIKSNAELRKVLDVAQGAARTPDRRVFVEDRKVRTLSSNIAGPLLLGNQGETHFVLEQYWKNHFERHRAAAGVQSPTVTDLRRWVDDPDRRGLPREIGNMLILVYADQTNRSFFLHGGTYTPGLDDMPGELELREQTLPEEAKWQTAVQRSAEVLGHTVPKLLNAANLMHLATKVQDTVQTYKVDCERLPERVELHLRDVGAEDADVGDAPRLKTGRAVRDLLVALDGKEPPEIVTRLAGARVETSGTAMGKSMKSASEVLACLSRTRWDLFQGVARITGDRQSEAEALLGDMLTWLKNDELAIAGGLAAKLDQAERRAVELLTPPKPPGPGPGPGPGPDVPTPGWRLVDQGIEERIDAGGWSSKADELRRQLEEHSDYRLTVRWKLEEESSE